MALKTGKKPATYDSHDLLYADFRPKDIFIPDSQKWGFGTDFTNWGMLGNGPDNSVFQGFGGCGDCAWAGPAHETEQAAHEAKRTIPHFTGAVVVEQYSEYSGYNPQTGANDNGSNVRDVLNWRQNKGLRDADGNVHKIGSYVQLELGNWDHLREACFLFEAVGLGFEFPDSAMDQFNNGKPWTVVSGAQIDGGHYVPIVGHPASGWWTCVTWGQRQMLTVQFISKYADELWAWIDAERYNEVTGETWNGYKDADLEKYLSGVALLKGLIK
jgi:hypothetical protein